MTRRAALLLGAAGLLLAARWRCSPTAPPPTPPAPALPEELEAAEQRQHFDPRPRPHPPAPRRDRLGDEVESAVRDFAALEALLPATIPAGVAATFVALRLHEPEDWALAAAAVVVLAAGALVAWRRRRR